MCSASDYKRLMRGVIPYTTVDDADKQQAK